MNNKRTELITDARTFINQQNRPPIGVGTVGPRAHEVALETRNFEIELYWKRATYFWAFVAASVTGYVAMRGSNSPEVADLSIIIAALGCFLTFAWLLVNRGSKYWQENWEAHVSMREYYTTRSSLQHRTLS